MLRFVSDAFLLRCQRSASLPLRSMPFQPPACRIPLLWKDRPAACLRNSSHQIVFHLVAFERRRQKLIDLYHAIRRAVCNTKLQQDAVSHIQRGENNNQRYHNSAQSALPVSPHTHHLASRLNKEIRKPKKFFITQIRITESPEHPGPIPGSKISMSNEKPTTNGSFWHSSLHKIKAIAVS